MRPYCHRFAAGLTADREAIIVDSSTTGPSQRAEGFLLLSSSKIISWPILNLVIWFRFLTFKKEKYFICCLLKWMGRFHFKRFFGNWPDQIHTSLCPAQYRCFIQIALFKRSEVLFYWKKIGQEITNTKFFRSLWGCTDNVIHRQLQNIKEILLKVIT